MLWGHLQAQTADTLSPGDSLYVHAPNGLNLRDRPGLDQSTIKTNLPYGTQVAVRGYDPTPHLVKDFGGYPIRAGWYQVEANHQVGWVFGGYLSRFPPPAPKLDEYLS
jgi:hypothetical protein